MDEAAETVTCPTCQGSGVVPRGQCPAELSVGGRCRTPPRAVTDPGYLARFKFSLGHTVPDFMAYCARHGNREMRELDAARRVNEKRRLQESGGAAG